MFIKTISFKLVNIYIYIYKSTHITYLKSCHNHVYYNLTRDWNNQIDLTNENENTEYEACNHVYINDYIIYNTHTHTHTQYILNQNES